MSAARRWPAAAVLLGVVIGVGSPSARAEVPGDGFWPDWAGTWARLTDPDAWREGHWRGVVSPYTAHWRPSDEHRHVYAMGLEWQAADRWLAGGSLFRNSFGQPSAYVYIGRRGDNLLGTPQLFWQWSAGMMYGYRGAYQHKVPLNVNGFSPGAVVSIGWQFDRNQAVTAHALGDAGVMLQWSWDWR